MSTFGRISNNILLLYMYCYIDYKLILNTHIINFIMNKIIFYIIAKYT